VDGRIKGKLVSTDGTVIVGENADIDADIQVAVAIVRGKMNGRIEASHRIEIYPPAHIVGDIAAPTVVIDSGVVFNGNCQMTDPSPKSGATAVKTASSGAEAAVLAEQKSKTL
jgi:cytoskeletal protein CcmA (bactofilin family)